MDCNRLPPTRTDPPADPPAAVHRFAPVLRSIIDSLDGRTTMYIADVSGKRAVHQASYAARLTEMVDVSMAEDRSPHVLHHGPTIVKVGAARVGTQ